MKYLWNIYDVVHILFTLKSSRLCLLTQLITFYVFWISVQLQRVQYKLISLLNAIDSRQKKIGSNGVHTPVVCCCFFPGGLVRPSNVFVTKPISWVTTGSVRPNPSDWKGLGSKEARPPSPTCWLLAPAATLIKHFSSPRFGCFIFLPSKWWCSDAFQQPKSWRKRDLSHQFEFKKRLNSEIILVICLKSSFPSV